MWLYVLIWFNGVGVGGLIASVCLWCVLAVRQPK